VQEWRIGITKDVVVKPKGSRCVRFVVIRKNRLHGTASFDYVFAFDCHEGAVRKIFEASGEDVQLPRTTAKEFTLTVKVWTPDKPDGPLYVNVAVQYRWSPEAQRFVRVTSNAQCPWVP
jgi:hypothetical protein